MASPAGAIGVLCVLVTLSLLLAQVDVPSERLHDLFWLPTALTFVALIVALAFNTLGSRFRRRSRTAKSRSSWTRAGSRPRI